MPIKYPVQSEGEELDGFLEELEGEHAIKEISGWETGFANLSRALDGIRTGLYLLIGPPACGKTAFAKQLLDQVAMHNRVPAIFFAFAESRKELRIRTLARLSGLESREIRRGSAYLLHWYGLPKAHYGEAGQLPPSWEKLKRLAREAKSWLDLTYIVECDRQTDFTAIERCVSELGHATASENIFVVIDDCQRLGPPDQRLQDRLAIVVERLQQAAANLKAPVLAIWPDLHRSGESQPQTWAEAAASADVILVLQKDPERSQTLGELHQALTLHVVKNRAGERGRLEFDFNGAVSKFTEAG